MRQKRLTIRSDNGLQARAMELLVQVAGRFESDVYIEFGDKRVNAKSIMGVLSMRLRMGDSFTVAASGADEDRAVEAVARLIEKGEAAR
jgi:catabolite repression HPr-like protein